MTTWPQFLLDIALFAVLNIAAFGLWWGVLTLGVEMLPKIAAKCRKQYPEKLIVDVPRGAWLRRADGRSGRRLQKRDPAGGSLPGITTRSVTGWILHAAGVPERTIGLYSEPTELLYGLPPQIINNCHPAVARLARDHPLPPDHALAPTTSHKINERPPLRWASDRDRRLKLLSDLNYEWIPDNIKERLLIAIAEEFGIEIRFRN